MTTIIAISDTHLERGDMYLHQDTINLIENAQLVLHAGDLGDETDYHYLLNKCEEFGCDLWAIHGSDSPIISEHSGLKIGLIHDYNGEASQSYDFSESEAYDIADSIGVDLMVFGHIHEPIVSWKKEENKPRRLLVCPGPGTIYGLYHKCPPTPTAAKIIVDNGKISSVQIISIDPSNDE
jgi:putative phosphoesterase